ncbi:MAG: DUF1049 domain-containing protein [Sphingobacteriaceae bacterium]|nr:MAG: DUF1049 domain-containing protein [Sphingobacteriaceae bacterium]
MKAKTLFAILLTVLITIVMMQNSDEVKFKVLFWDLYLPKLVILTGAIFIGVILGLIMASRPTKTIYTNTNNENQNNNQRPFDTLSAEDRDYISE